MNSVSQLTTTTNERADIGRLDITEAISLQVARQSSSTQGQFVVTNGGESAFNHKCLTYECPCYRAVQHNLFRCLRVQLHGPCQSSLWLRLALMIFEGGL